MTLKYAKGPVSYLYKDVTKDGNTKRKRVKQLIWGDWVQVSGTEKPGWLKVKFGRKRYLMKAADLQDERVLEIIFLDVGQGDGCILTEPGEHADPKILVVDAGVGRNMNAFINWRFRDFDSSGKIHAAIITHPDIDHYKGFQSVFQNDKLEIGHVYHNGIVERTGDARLGHFEGGYLTDIKTTDAGVRTLLANPANRGRMPYPKLLHTAINNPKIGPITALTCEHGTRQNGRSWVPNFAPDDPGPVDIEILGPVLETDGSGNARLRAFGSKPTSTSMDIGKTKNGHSVLMRLSFNGFRVLFGGDLNRSSETFLMLWYGDNENVPAPLTSDRGAEDRIADNEVIERASDRFRVDLMKSCHHGSSDVTEEFLLAGNPSAFVISSGDKEGHVHPRPDLLGLLGKTGHGPRPLLLSTELLRATREREDPKLRSKIEGLSKRIEQEISQGAAGNDEVLKELRSQRRKLRDEAFKRNVGVFGAVNLRTDGENAIIAFRKEQASPTKRWFYYELKRDPATGSFVPKLSGH